MFAVANVQRNGGHAQVGCKRGQKRRKKGFLMRNTRSLGVSAFCMGSSLSVSFAVLRGASGNVRPGTAFFSRGSPEERTLESAHLASATENLLPVTRSRFKIAVAAVSRGAS